MTLGGDFSGKQTISSIKPGETQTVTIAPKPAPKSGDERHAHRRPSTPVCGEQIDSNNKSTYDITFG